MSILDPGYNLTLRPMKCAECELPVKVQRLGLCSKHYHRHRRGSLSSKRDHKTLTERVMYYLTAYGLQGEDCWNWKRLSTTGYGLVLFNYKNYLAHRAVYSVLVGEIPEGMQVCHTCDNRACVNPKHLWLGSQSDNIKDGWKKGRIPGRYGKKS